MNVWVVHFSGGPNCSAQFHEDAFEVFGSSDSVNKRIREKIAEVYDVMGDPAGDDPLPKDVYYLRRLMADCYDFHVAAYAREVIP